MSKVARKLMKSIISVFLIIFLSLTIISCSSEDDPALKEGKVAARLSEADSFEPPYISLLTIDDSSAATNQNTVSIKLTGADAVGITGYIISNQSTAPDLSSSDWVGITSQTQYSVSKDSTVGPSDGSYSFYGWMKDAANNISATASSSIYYDTTAPAISSVSINSGDSSTSNTVVSITISASDNLSGINAYYASETSTDPSATATGWVDITSTNSLSSTVSFTLSSNGAAAFFIKKVFLWVKDAAGNVSSSSSDSITLFVADTTVPSSPTININSGAGNTSNTVVSLALSATDNVGITAYYASESSSKPSSSDSGWNIVASSTSYSNTVSFTLSSAVSAGNHSRTVYVWFKDAAGNVSASASDVITLVVSDTTVGLFVVVGESGTILTSLNGTTWTSRTSGTTNKLRGVTHANSTFVAVGTSGTILTSSDATTWTSRDTSAIPWYLDNQLESVIYANSTFVSVGDSGIILTSSDGITWTLRNTNTTRTLYAVAYGNGEFVAAGLDLITSSDGFTWTSYTSMSWKTRFDLVYGGSIFVSVGGGGHIYTSSDLATWYGRHDAVGVLYGVTYGNSTFVSVGEQGTIVTSSDGISWTSRNSGTTYKKIYGVNYGNGLFVAVGDFGTILTSSDATTWTSRTSGTSKDLYSVTY